MSDYEFSKDIIDPLKRNLTIEGEIGTELGIGGGVTFMVLAASDANPRWRQGAGEMQAELNRLINAKADAARVKKFLAREYSRRLVIGWFYTDPDMQRHEGLPDGKGNHVPFSADACFAYLMQTDDPYELLDGMVKDTRNFRGQRVEGTVERVGN